MSSKKCTNSANIFCYICGQFCVSSQKRPITANTKNYFELYFGRVIENRKESWIPEIVCKCCEVNLCSWWNGKRAQMPFAVPMKWDKPRNHRNDCYFCMTTVIGFSSKNKHAIKYPECRSAVRPVLHGDNFPVPISPNPALHVKELTDPAPNGIQLHVPCQNIITRGEFVDEAFLSETSSSSNTTNDTSNGLSAAADPNYVPDPGSCNEPHLLDQGELSDLIRDLDLTKQKAELLASRMRQWNFLKEETMITLYRNRNDELKQFFSKENSISFCLNIDGLMEFLGFNHKPSEWRLFIDGSTESLKAVLLHNGNEKPTIPLAHTVVWKESRESIEEILKVIKYEEYQWDICPDLKVVSMLMGLQGGYTKHMCFLCLWDSRADGDHYTKKVWPPRTTFVPGKMNVEHAPLVSQSKIILPPLHIKLGLFKSFAKKLKPGGMQYLRDKFPRLSDAKLKEGVFVGPQIKKVIEDKDFHKSLEPIEKTAWKCFKNVVSGFLGNHKEDNYEDLIAKLLDSYHKMGVRQSLKIHLLDSHLDFFPENLGAVSDEQGERFHQDIAAMERRYQGRWDEGMLSDHCWFLMRDHKNYKFNRKSNFATNKSTKKLS